MSGLVSRRVCSFNSFVDLFSLNSVDTSYRMNSLASKLPSVCASVVSRVDIWPKDRTCAPSPVILVLERCD